MKQRPVPRFAPSPTGYLHRGHALSALWVWACAAKFGYTVHLRIEDHDRGRARPEYITAIREDLHWLGFQWSEESIQSAHENLYINAMERLKARGLLYACNCPRKSLLNGNTSTETREIIYQGTCRNKNLPFTPDTAIRIRIPDETIFWEDLRLGSFSQVPARQCGDFTLRDRAGQWTYQFAVCVDDIHENTNLIVRGEDLLDSTARQIQLLKTLGRSTPPIYLHHPLILADTGLKLSKRQQAASLRGERASGASPEVIFGEICFQTNLTDTNKPITLQNAISLITKQLDRVI